MRSDLPELYVAADVEADGPIPGPYSMLSLDNIPHSHNAGDDAVELAAVFLAILGQRR